METPERIYFGEADKSVLDIYSTQEHDDEVEYIRKDAFIEKACDAYCKICKVPNCRSNECKWISDLKGHLETI
jgi:hypothetical protein